MFRHIREHEESGPFSDFPSCKTAEGRVHRGVRAHAWPSLAENSLAFVFLGAWVTLGTQDAVPAFSEWWTPSGLHFGFSQWLCCAFVGTCVERNVTIFRPTLGTSLVVDGGHPSLPVCSSSSFLSARLPVSSTELGVRSHQETGWSPFLERSFTETERKGPDELLVRLTVRLTSVRNGALTCSLDCSFCLRRVAT